jgi:hypothetical protein
MGLFVTLNMTVKSDIMLIANMLSIAFFIVILSVVMLRVVMLSVVMLSVEAP